MAHGTEHHLEEAHHAEHASHDDFNKRVAMTMAIIAACLAFVTLLSHRAHNLVLQYQIKANMKKTEASDRWSQYQAKNIRKNEYEAFMRMLPVLATAEKQADAKKVTDGFEAQVKRYNTPAEEEEEEQKKKGEKKIELKELPGIMVNARELDKEAVDLYRESEHYHHRADRFDLGELGIELALVICSVSVLTKNKLFWISGLAIGSVGFLVAMSAYVQFLMPH